MTGGSEPTYDLESAKYLVRVRQFWTSPEVGRTLARDGLDMDDLWDCFQSLTPSDFHKTMESKDHPGRMLDVYRTTYCGVRLYVKFYLIGKEDGLYVLSLKEDESR